MRLLLVRDGMIRAEGDNTLELVYDLIHRYDKDPILRVVELNVEGREWSLCRLNYPVGRAYVKFEDNEQGGFTKEAFIKEASKDIIHALCGKLNYKLYKRL